jgi:predicted small secreted protein
MLRKFVTLLALAGFAFTLAACNTVAGVGADVKAAGGAVEKAAQKTKSY